MFGYLLAIPFTIMENAVRVVAQQHDPVEMQLVKGVGELGASRIQVGQRQRRERAEPFGVVGDDAGEDLVGAPASGVRPRRTRPRRPGSTPRAQRSTALRRRSRARP